MNIQSAAKKAGLPVKTVRYYDEIGLVKPDRQPNGYRQFDDTHIHKLTFLGRARRLGFSLEDCRQLLSLYEDTSRASSDVKSIAQARICDIDRKLEELNSLRHTLVKLADACQGNNRPDCPILDGLARGVEE